jgi:hypothetical protein
MQTLSTFPLTMAFGKILKGDLDSILKLFDPEYFS